MCEYCNPWKAKPILASWHGQVVIERSTLRMLVRRHGGTGAVEGAARVSRLVKRLGRYGSDWYLENDEGDVAWVAPMVKEHIERIEADLLLAQRIIGQISHEGFELIDDNKKLRELVETMHSDMCEMLDTIDKGSDTWGFCRYYRECLDCAETCMRELGIEVD